MHFLRISQSDAKLNIIYQIHESFKQLRISNQHAIAFGISPFNVILIEINS